MSTFYHWFVNNWIENLAVLTGILYIVLSVKQKAFCWFFGIASSLFYLFVFYRSKIYADMVLQAYYVVIGIYGWLHWKGIDKKGSTKDLPITIISMKSTILLSCITLVIFIGIGQLLTHFTDSPVPWMDAFTTSLGIIGTWMIARKILENWIVWMVANLFCIGLFYYRALYSSILLFLVYTVLAVIGYYEWKREWKRSQSLKTT